MIAKTVNSKAVRNLGLVPNSAAYRLQLETEQGKNKLFKVYSSLPCNWIGSHTAVNNTALNNLQPSRIGLDL